MSTARRVRGFFVLASTLCLALSARAATTPTVPTFAFVKHAGSCAAAGARIDVRGSGFGKKGQYQLTARSLPGQPALATSSWSDRAIVATVPPGPGGTVVLAMRDAKGSFRGNTTSFAACATAASSGRGGALAPLSHGFGRSMVPPSTLREPAKPPRARRPAPGKPPAPLGAEPQASPATPTRIGPSAAAAGSERSSEIVVLLRTRHGRLDGSSGGSDPAFGALRERHELATLGLALEVRTLAAGTDVDESLRRLRRLPEVLAADLDHRLDLLVGEGLAAAEPDPRRYAGPLIGWTETARRCGRGLRIGLIDTGVDVTHPLLRGADVRARPFAAPPSSREHATAIAGLLIGGPESLLPGAELWVAEAVAAATGADPQASIEAVTRGLDWLAGKDLGVINMSLGGPRNAVLAEVLRRVLARGVHVVAAAGNGGPHAAPVHPAAQPGVIAVAAVDARKRLWRRSNRGRYVDLVAPGVDLWVARPGGEEAFVSGTSFAAPFVAAALAVEGRGADLERVLGSVEDLGDPGRDPVYGRGLLRAPAACGASGAGRAEARAE